MIDLDAIWQTTKWDWRRSGKVVPVLLLDDLIAELDVRRKVMKALGETLRGWNLPLLAEVCDDAYLEALK